MTASVQSSLGKFNGQNGNEIALAPMTAKTYTGRYAMHRYWARKPYNIVANYINHFTKEGDIVLDPFCGSGVTAIEALILKRKAVAIDLDPVATFITKNTGAFVDMSELINAYRDLELKVKTNINSFYETQCPNCLDKAITQNTIWKDGLPTKIKYNCPNCGKTGRKEVDRKDLAKIKKVEASPIPFWYPQDQLLHNSRINAFKGMHVSDLFTRRNLIALSTLWYGIEHLHFDNSVRDLMRFTFTAAISQASKMVFVIRRRGRLNGIIKGRSKMRQAMDVEEVGSRAIGYWIPPEHFEINAWNCFENRFKKVLAGKKQTNELIDGYYRQAQDLNDLITGNKTILILTHSATDLSFLPRDSIDYVFTDPPYGDQVPYLELDALWAFWLKFKMDYENEIVISDSPVRNKGLPQYKEGLAKAFKQIYDVLKPGKFMSVCFYNYDLKVWHVLISACFDSGFEKVNILPITVSHPSIVQLFRPGGSKGALIITFRKPTERRLKSKNLVSQENVNNIVIDTVRKLILKKGDATTYEIYDKVITVLIDNNALDNEMNIFRLLRDKFDLVKGKWKIRAPITKQQ